MLGLQNALLGVRQCGRGGIGRRAALRSLWGNSRGSSSLLDRTIPFRSYLKIAPQLFGKIYNFQNAFSNFVEMLTDTNIKRPLRIYKCGALFATSVEFSNACLSINRAAVSLASFYKKLVVRAQRIYVQVITVRDVSVAGLVQSQQNQARQKTGPSKQRKISLR